LSAVRVAAPLPAAAVLGLVGVVSGVLLVAAGPGIALGPLALGAVSGAVYGGLGGLILGRVVAPPPSEGAEP
jgi:hypothetical protein